MRAQRINKNIVGFGEGKLPVFLRECFPHDTAKLVGNLLGAPPRTVESWLCNGSAPGFYTLGKMIECWGPAFLVGVMASPAQWMRDSQAREELNEIEFRIAELKGALAQNAK